MQGVRTVRLTADKVGYKSFLLFPNMPVEELSAVICKTFGLSCDILGFEDQKSTALFPIQCVASDPSYLCDGGVYKIVMSPEESVHCICLISGIRHDESHQDVDIRQFSTSHSETIRQKLPNLTYLGEATGLCAMSAGEVFQQFQQNASNGSLTRFAFQDCFRDLFDRKANKSCNESDMDRIVNSLFDTFDVDGNGFVDMNELASGLVVLCGGKDEDRIRAAFNLYDVNKDGFISKKEMQDYLISAFRVIFSTSSGKLSSVISPEDLARATTDDCFRQAARTNDQLLSFDEFKAWYEGSCTSPHCDVDVIKLLCINRVSVMKLMTTLNCNAVGNYLTISNLGDAFNQLIESFDDVEVIASDVDQSVHSLFLALEKEDFVSLTSICAGLSPFCHGNLIQAVMDGLSFFDDDGDGFVNHVETESFLMAFYSVSCAIFANSPTEAPDPRTTALVAATDAFRQIDSDHTGIISRYDFACWFASTIAISYGINQPDEHCPSYDRLPSAPSMSLQSMQLSDHLRPRPVLITPHPLADFLHGILCLGDRRVDSLMTAFLARCQSGQQFITLSLFVQLMAGQLATLRSQARVSATDKMFIEHLFELLDSDRDKKVSVGDLSRHLEVFRSENHSTRLSSVISLYDLNGDDYVSKKDLINFQCAMSKVLECVSIDAKQFIENSIANIEVLSTQIVDQIFIDAGLVDSAPIACIVDWYINHCIRECESNSSPNQSIPSSPTAHRMCEFDIPAETNMRDALRLNQATPEMIISTLKKVSRGCDVINMQQFEICLNEIAHLTNLTSNVPQSFVMRLFTVFDADGDAIVRVNDVIIGLVCMCGGREKAKLICGLSVQDVDRDGKLSLNDLMGYLTVVNVIRRGVDGDDLQGFAPENVARGTAVDAFMQYSRRIDSRLTIEEAADFLSFGTEGASQQTNDRKNFMKMTSAISQADLNNDFDFPSSGPLWSSSVARSKFGLSNCSFNRAVEMLNLYSSHGEISRQGFVAAIQNLSQVGGSCSTSICQSLFDAFDDNGDDLALVSDLLSSFTLLVGDQRPVDRASFAFDMFDSDRDGFLTRGELRDYLACIYKALFCLQPDLTGWSSINPSVLANETSERIFHDYDANVREGRLSKQGFVSWFESDMSQSEDGSTGDAEDSNDDDVDIVDNFGLRNMTIGSLHEALVSLSGPSGSMSRDAFVSFLSGISVRFGKSINGGPKLVDVAHDIFSIVASSESSVVVDVGLLSSYVVVSKMINLTNRALGMMAGSNKQDKIENIVRHLNSAFSKRLSVIYTSSSNIMEAEITSKRIMDVIRAVVGTLTVSRQQDVSTVGVRVNELVSKLFMDSSASSSNVIRLSKVKDWIFENFNLLILPATKECRNNNCHLRLQEKYRVRPESRQSARPIRELLFPHSTHSNNIPVRSDDEHVERSPPLDSFCASSLSDLKNAQSCLGLDALSCDEVVDIVMEKFPRSTSLNFAQWSQLVRVTRQLSCQDSPVPQMLIRRLFDAFDNSKMGKVNSVDFAAGLASLTCSSAEDKIKTAFRLYDLDEDDCLTFGQFYEYMNASMLMSCACSGVEQGMTGNSAEFSSKCSKCSMIAFAACKHFFQTHGIDENDVVDAGSVGMFAEQCMNLARCK